MVLSKLIRSGMAREEITKMQGRKESLGYYRESKPSTGGQKVGLLLIACRLHCCALFSEVF